MNKIIEEFDYRAALKESLIKKESRMTQQEYDNEKSRLIGIHNGWVKELNKVFVRENHLYDIGDIIRDHYHIIKIEKISVHPNFQKYPCALYHGIELTKKLKPMKRQECPIMYEMNIEEKL